MVFGPNMQNFAEVVASFLDKDGAIQVETRCRVGKRDVMICWPSSSARKARAKMRWQWCGKTRERSSALWT